jgi:hypothetical protein
MHITHIYRSNAGCLVSESRERPLSITMIKNSVARSKPVPVALHIRTAVDLPPCPPPSPSCSRVIVAMGNTEQAVQSCQASELIDRLNQVWKRFLEELLANIK